MLTQRWTACVLAWSEVLPAGLDTEAGSIPAEPSYVISPQARPYERFTVNPDIGSIPWSPVGDASTAEQADGHADLGQGPTR
jgi:hypothetical protein